MYYEETQKEKKLKEDRLLAFTLEENILNILDYRNIDRNKKDLITEVYQEILPAIYKHFNIFGFKNEDGIKK